MMATACAWPYEKLFFSQFRPENAFSNNFRYELIICRVTRTTGSFLDNTQRNLWLAGLRPHVTFCRIHVGIIGAHFINFHRTLILLRTNTSCHPSVSEPTCGKEFLAICLPTCSWRINNKMSTNDGRILTFRETAILRDSTLMVNTILSHLKNWRSFTSGPGYSKLG